MSGKSRTPRSWHYNGVSGHIGCDPNSIPTKYDDFERGTRWAAIAMFGMFAFLSLGVVAWGW